MNKNHQIKLFAVIGNPIYHSLSPKIHNKAFDALGLTDYLYLPLLVENNNLKQALLGLKALGFLGCNITLPFKENTLKFIDELSIDCKAIGACNTVVVDSKNKLIGHNTDHLGFINDLLRKKIPIHALSGVVLGSGGAAKAILYGLARGGCNDLTVIARNLIKAESICMMIQDLFPKVNIKCISYHKKQIESVDLNKKTLIVNCTSLGLRPDDIPPWPADLPLTNNCIVYDLIYSPSETSLLKLAKDNNIKYYNGMGMLLEQAALSFELFTPYKFPFDKVVKKI